MMLDMFWADWVVNMLAVITTPPGASEQPMGLSCHWV